MTVYQPEEARRQGLNDCVPKRLYKFGQKPKVGSIMDKSAHEKWVWQEDRKGYTSNQKQRLLAAVVEQMVIATFSTHLYKWAGQIHLQRKGGPIGLRATGSMAKASMEDWIRRFQDKLEGMGLKIHLLVKYVGDVLCIVDNCKLGERFRNGRVEWS